MRVKLEVRSPLAKHVMKGMKKKSIEPKKNVKRANVKLCKKDGHQKLGFYRLTDLEVATVVKANIRNNGRFTKKRAVNVASMADLRVMAEKYKIKAEAMRHVLRSVFDRTYANYDHNLYGLVRAVETGEKVEVKVEVKDKDKGKGLEHKREVVKRTAVKQEIVKHDNVKIEIVKNDNVKIEKVKTE